MEQYAVHIVLAEPLHLGHLHLSCSCPSPWSSNLETHSEFTTLGLVTVVTDCSTRWEGGTTLAGGGGLLVLPHAVIGILPTH